MERFMDFTFVAAQRLPGVGPDHRAAALHGHTFAGTVRLNADPHPETGWVVDPADLKREIDAVLAAIDHRFLNELPGLDNPSTENLCRYLKAHLAERLCGRVEVELWENPAVGCTSQGARA
ncbi:MAG: 6-carboxytetrahydropterin synthase QueD [Rhodospirillales bacterium CG15_BIG_FIL_POST_REV_8_21_14_020_66_15]|nr:MAG: 6-carboxytetrahydropterin synthase QueD [Rhodospirillales bacterium CG15_BIG_FIL_POST_REV_8_21_14_020_66_15]